MITPDHRGGRGGVSGGLKYDHEILEQPLIRVKDFNTILSKFEFRIISSDQHGLFSSVDCQKGTIYLILKVYTFMDLIIMKAR